MKHSSRRLVFTVFGLLLAVAVFAPAFSAPQTDLFTLDGKITKLVPGKVTVNSGENILFHVAYNDKTQFTKADGSAGSDHDLRVGLTIHVEGELTESGEIVAATIALQDKSEEKP